MVFLQVCGPDSENCVTLVRPSTAHKCDAEEGLRITQEEPN